METQPLLMSEQEMMEKYQRGEDHFELVIEKWNRIRDFLDFAFSKEDFVSVLRAAYVIIPFCLELGKRNQCFKCPIKKVCVPEGDKESFWMALVRLLHAYALAGDFLPPEPIRRVVSQFVDTLKDCQNKFLAKSVSGG